MNLGAPSAQRTREWLGFAPVVWSWALYDAANTVFSALFLSINFPLVIHWFGGTDRHIGWATSGAALVGAAVVPFLGTISDRIGKRMPFVAACTATCCLLTPSVAYLNLVGAVLVGALAMLAYDMGLALYDPILSDIVAPEEQGRASGLGSGLGYGGTLVALACVAPIYHFMGSDTRDSMIAVNWMIGLLFIGMSVPLFAMHREAGTGETVRLREALAASFGRVAEGASRASGALWTFIAASFFYVNAAMAVVVFFGIFALKTLGLTMAEFLPIYAGLAVAAGVGSFLAGWLCDRHSPKIVLVATGALWIVTIFYLRANLTLDGFRLAGIFGGIGLGSVYTSMRPFLIRLADPARVGESFGFLGVASRAGAIVGPAMFGELSDRYGQKTALLGLAGFFAAGLVVFCFVPDGEGEDMDRMDRNDGMVGAD